VSTWPSASRGLIGRPASSPAGEHLAVRLPRPGRPLSRQPVRWRPGGDRVVAPEDASIIRDGVDIDFHADGR